MGLDGVELVMAVEDEFKISISDSDAAQCVTVGKLVDLIYSRLRHNTQDPCLSQQGFHIVRKTMMERLGLKRSQIKLEAKLDDFIGRSNRREVLQKLLNALRGNETECCPSLERPKWMTPIVSLVIPVVVCVSIVSLTWLPFIVALLVAVVAGILANLMTTPFKREFPASLSTVQDLIKFTRTLDSRKWTKDEVFKKIREITVEQLGVKESQVTLEARFIEDLLLD